MARFLIADLSGSNANVFYEVGLAHALEKPTVLLVREGEDVPFDLRGIRYIRYLPDDLAGLKQRLSNYLPSCLRSIPKEFSSERPPEGPAVRVVAVDAPEFATDGQPLRIVVTARNFGHDASQAYLTVSLPSGVDRDLRVDSDIHTKTGQKGQPWRSGEVRLQYPIAEASVYAQEGAHGWRSGVVHSLTVEVTPNCRGIQQFYVSASAKCPRGPLVYDPASSFLLDHRDERVYSGTIVVR